jgi:hypothetical protein
MCLLLSSHIPELDSGVPTARVNLIRALKTKFSGEDFVGMSALFTFDYLDRLQSFLVVDFDLRQKTSNSKSLEVICIVNTLVLIQRIKYNFLAFVIHLCVPSHQTSITHRTKKHLISLEFTLCRPPSEPSNRKASFSILFCNCVRVKLINSIAEHATENLNFPVLKRSC